MNILKKISIALVSAVAVVGTVGSVQAETLSGGDVLPANATPNGYSLTDLAKLIAPFQDTFDTSLLPSTPFQILYIPTPTSTSNSFTVNSDTLFYVPLSSVNDSPPILGTFPSDASQSAFYFFDKSQLGGRDFTITVDGKSTPIGAEYLAGPVMTEKLPNGGMNSIVLGAFLSPFSVGTHTVEIKTQFDGDLLGGQVFSGDVVYTIKTNPASVPESSSVVGILVFGTLSAGLLIKRQVKKKANVAA